MLRGPGSPTSISSQTAASLRTRFANNVGNDPSEVLFYYNDTASTQTVNLAVGLHAGSAPADFKVMVLDNGAGVHVGASNLNQSDGTIYGHSAAGGAIAVAAADYHNTPPTMAATPVVKSYSRRGRPRSITTPPGICSRPRMFGRHRPSTAPMRRDH